MINIFHYIFPFFCISHGIKVASLLTAYHLCPTWRPTAALTYRVDEYRTSGDVLWRLATAHWQWILSVLWVAGWGLHGCLNRLESGTLGFLKAPKLLWRVFVVFWDRGGVFGCFVLSDLMQQLPDPKQMYLMSDNKMTLALIGWLVHSYGRRTNTSLTVF